MVLINKKLRFVHWIIFILVCFMLASGFSLGLIKAKETKFFLMGCHKATGTVIFWLMCLRLFWRVKYGIPDLPGSKKSILNVGARLAQGLLYGLLFFIPLDRFLMTQYGGYPVPFYGLFTYPQLIAKNKALAPIFYGLHGPLAWSLLGVLCLHILGALKHHFIDKDNVLRQMTG